MKLLDRLARRFGFGRVATRNHSFAGAKISRLTLDWIRAPLSGDKELEGDMLQLRARSRDLVRNNPYARRFLRLAQNHIVGPKGIRLRPTNMIGERPHDTLNDAIAAGWKEWCRPRHASADGQFSWLGLQRLAVAEMVQSGEGLFQIVYDRANPFGISLLAIDPDRLDERFMRPAGDDKNEVRYGIEIDRIGRRVAYHILSQHPSEFGRVAGGRSQFRERIPADQIIHLTGNDDRVGRLRGVTWFAVVMRDMRHLDGAQEASVVALRSAASAFAVVVTKDPNGEVETPDENAYLEMEPGVAPYLGLNQELQSWNPHAPSDNFPEFSKAVLRASASGLGTSYAVLAGDWSDANMSSMRVGRAEEQEGWMAWQEYLIENFCMPVYDAWLKSAMLSGAVKIPSFDMSRAMACQWHPRRWVSVDPVKDIEADERAVALGVRSRTMIAARNGDDLWDIWDQLAEEQEYAKEEGLNVEPPRKSTTAGAPNNDGEQATTDEAASGNGSDDGGEGGGGGSGDHRDRHQLRIARSAV